jgi:very-short-patch-repair endonuclease
MPSTRARQLRSNPTEAEKRLWSKLRLKQIDGNRFRRQVPIGRYVVDFVCFDRCLIIEVDGGQHDSRIVQDDARTAWLQREGFRVLRFWNNEVLGNIEGVYDVIVAHLADGHVPPP